MSTDTGAVTAAAAAVTSAAVATYISSDFDIFARKPIQSSVLDTTEIAFKPIASIGQNDLEFHIPAVSDLYTNLNIKLYVRGRLVKADGTSLAATDKTGVVNNLLHSLFSQCAISLNGTSITSASELYPYRSYLETIFLYGSDAAATHLTNGFWYIDEGSMLPCDPIVVSPQTEVSSLDIIK